MTRARPDYTARPSKAVQRYMIVDICRRLTAFAPLATYRYVGLGGLEFIDFDLIHRGLGITDMISIEQRTPIDRYEFNVPFKTIKVLGGPASEQLASIDWTPLSIVWLDYECQLNRTILDEDITLLCTRLQPGSGLFVTLNATSPSAMADRRDELVTQVGEERIPSGVTNDALGVWGLAAVQRRILTDAIVASLRSREVPAVWHQVFNTQYADGARMQTLGGVVATAGMSRSVEACRFDELEFVRTGPDALLIRVPLVTQRERMYIESRLPLDPGETLTLPWLSDDDVQAFITVYRYHRSASPFG